LYAVVSVATLGFCLIALQVAFAFVPETIIITDGFMTIKHTLGPIPGRCESFEIGDISNLHVDWVPLRRKNASRSVRQIVFDYRGKQISFGRDLSENVAASLMEGPLSRLRQPATSS